MEEAIGFPGTWRFCRLPDKGWGCANRTSGHALVLAVGAKPRAEVYRSEGNEVRRERRQEV